MIMPIIGFMMSSLIFTTMFLVKSFPAEFLLLANFPLSFMGSWPGFNMAVNRYTVFKEEILISYSLHSLELLIIV